MESFFKVNNITNTFVELFFSFSILLLLFSYHHSYFANAQEEVITIVPGS